MAKHNSFLRNAGLVAVLYGSLAACELRERQETLSVPSVSGEIAATHAIQENYALAASQAAADGNISEETIVPRRLETLIGLPYEAKNEGYHNARTGANSGHTFLALMDYKGEVYVIYANYKNVNRQSSSRSAIKTLEEEIAQGIKNAVLVTGYSGIKSCSEENCYTLFEIETLTSDNLRLVFNKEWDNLNETLGRTLKFSINTLYEDMIHASSERNTAPEDNEK